MIEKTRDPVSDCVKEARLTLTFLIFVMAVVKRMATFWIFWLAGVMWTATFWIFLMRVVVVTAHLYESRPENNLYGTSQVISIVVGFPSAIGDEILQAIAFAWAESGLVEIGDGGARVCVNAIGNDALVENDERNVLLIHVRSHAK